MKINRAWMSAALMATMVIPTIAPAQFDFGGGSMTPVSSKPWESFKLDAKKRMQLDFRNSNVDNVLSLFQKTSGVTIVKDPSLTGGITLTSAKPVSLNQAFQILSTTLGLKGYEIGKEDNLLVIRKKDQQQNRGGMGGGNWQMPQGIDFGSLFGGGGSQTQLKVYPIKHANASQVARVVNEVFAMSGQQQNPLQQLMQQFAGGGQNNRFGGQQNNRFGGGMQGFMGRMGQGNQPQGGSVVRASSDDFSNSIIVNAPDREQGQVRALIEQIDKQTEEPQKSKVFKVEFASAEELAPIVQNVLVSNAPRGRGGIGTQNVPPEQRFQQALRFGSSQAAFGQVVADPRTNSLIITATDENIAVVEKVINELDTEVKFESSTFVFSLSNARADDVSNLLFQAFGQRQGVGGVGGNRNFQGGAGNRNTQQNRNNQNRNNQNRNTGGARLQNNLSEEEMLRQGLALNLQDPTGENGELETTVAVTQGFGQGFFGGGGQRQGGGAARSTQQTGRDEQGRLVNVRDLSGQVTAIPDPNTNSIIVVTTPENAELIRGILDQLDKIPEQVMIETLIVEATLDDSTRFGVEWSLANRNVLGNQGVNGTASSNFGQQSTTPPQQGFRYTLTGGNLQAYVNALKTDSKFQILSTPRIFTSNNVEAQINISQSVPFIVNSRQDPNGGFTFNYSFTDVGIILTVTPRITSNGYVTMDVNQTANDLQGFTDFNAPIINQRQADTTVSVKDGETIILGGIIRSTVNATTRKIPLLGDIPLLGNLFKTTTRDKAKTELLVFLTPRIVRDPDEARRLREEGERQLSPETRKTLDEKVKQAPAQPVRTGNGGNGN